MTDHQNLGHNFLEGCILQWQTTLREKLEDQVAPPLPPRPPLSPKAIDPQSRMAVSVSFQQKTALTAFDIPLE